MKKTYTPAPIDTSRVELDLKMKKLIERLAKNTHENWAAERIADGWTYGPQRDDEKKQSPCLVPYGELEESEKKYDRKIVEEIIKTLLAAGYKINGSGSCKNGDANE